METNRGTSSLIIIIVIALLLVGATTLGFVAGRLSNSGISLQPSSSATSVPGSNELFKPFWEAWKIVHDEYIDQPVDDEKMMQGAIRGMMESLGDPHSSYMNPDEYEDANSQLVGYYGIGAWVSTEGEYLTIIEPIKGSPAEAAGLKSGDQIIAIDGEDMTGTLPELARQKVLGEPGTQVVLTVKRDEIEKPFDVTVTRAKITIPSIEYRMLDNNIAYIRLSAFSNTSEQELRAALEELLAKNPGGLILDLRYNVGGYLDAAIQVGSEFLPDGVIAFEEFANGKRETFNASGKGIATEIPMIVLVNEWSASASELVAGALQDRGRAQLVGVKTFGKGTVQNWIALSDNEGAVRVTIARWLTPNGRNVTDNGLDPDYEVTNTEEDTKAGKDPQLDKAVEILINP